MPIIIRSFILILPFFLLMSCAQPFNSHGKQYLAAQSTPPLHIPPGLSSKAFDTTYPVSSRNYPKSATDISLLPPNLQNQNRWQPQKEWV